MQNERCYEKKLWMWSFHNTSEKSPTPTKIRRASWKIILTNIAQISQYEFLCRSRYVFIKSLGFKFTFVGGKFFFSLPQWGNWKLFNLITSHAFLEWNRFIVKRTSAQNSKSLRYFRSIFQWVHRHDAKFFPRVKESLHSEKIFKNKNLKVGTYIKKTLIRQNHSKMIRVKFFANTFAC